MSKKQLPKAGDKVPIDKFHVSKLNVRADEPFGEAEEDRLLISQLRRGKIIGPFKARPEGKGYGVVVGRRRFLAKRQTTTRDLVVGSDCLIEEMSDDEAREASLIENLAVLRKQMNPLARAKQLSQIISHSPLGLRGIANHLGIPASTLSEWLKPLDLTPKMQKALSEEQIFFTDAVQVARLDLGEEKQDELAELVEKEGQPAFKAEVTKLSGKGLSRGIPPGKYEIVRAAFDKHYDVDMEDIKKLNKKAEEWHIDRNKAGKRIIHDYLKDVEA